MSIEHNTYAYHASNLQLTMIWSFGIKTATVFQLQIHNYGCTGVTVLFVHSVHNRNAWILEDLHEVPVERLVTYEIITRNSVKMPQINRYFTLVSVTRAKGSAVLNLFDKQIWKVIETWYAYAVVFLYGCREGCYKTNVDIFNLVKKFGTKQNFGLDTILHKSWICNDGTRLRQL